MSLRIPLILVFLAACGDTTLRRPLKEQPTPPYWDGGLDTGNTGAGAGSGAGVGGSNGAGAGSGGGGGTSMPQDAGPVLPQCPDAKKRCAAEFSYPAGAEASVEVRGDFADDGWTTGVKLTKAGATWKGSVAVPWGQPVQYKLVLDGATWVLDPANPKTGVTAGVTNSLVDNVTCAKWTCQD